MQRCIEHGTVTRNDKLKLDTNCIDIQVHRSLACTQYTTGRHQAYAITTLITQVL